MAKIFFVGDSITAGAWDPKGGWANRLSGKIMARTYSSANKFKGFYCMPYNLGVSGDTAPDIVRRLENEVTARVYGAPEDDTIQFVLAVGVNDSIYSLDEGRQFYNDDEFLDDFTRIIDIMKIFTNNINVIGLLPVDETRVNPTPWAEGKAYKNDSIAHFNGMIKSVCETQNIDFLNLFADWLAMPDLADHFTDGLHPNEKGHALMEKTIGDFLFTDGFTQLHTKE